MEINLSLEVLNNVSEIDIVYKKKVTCKVSERPLIGSSADAYKVCMHYWNPDKIELLEEFKVLFLSRSNRVLQIFPVSQGGITGTVADPRLILAGARADEELTIKIREAAKYFDMKVLDHLIITSEGYFSFADEGLL